MRQGFELVEHTADVGLRAWGPTPEGVFEEAAKGMFSLICDPLTIEEQRTEEISLEADLTDVLLVDWLNELLYTFEARRVLFSQFEVHIEGDRLEARATGEVLDPRRHAICGGVKAATLHQLSLCRRIDGWEALVYFDI